MTLLRTQSGSRASEGYNVRPNKYIYGCKDDGNFTQKLKEW